MRFDFLYTLFRKISHYTNNSARYYHKCQTGLHATTRNSCRILIKHELSRQIFENYSNVKFHEKSEPSCSMRTKDGQTG